MSFANKNGALLLHDVAIANNSTALLVAGSNYRKTYM